MLRWLLVARVGRDSGWVRSYAGADRAAAHPDAVDHRRHSDARAGRCGPGSADADAVVIVVATATPTRGTAAKPHGHATAPPRRQRTSCPVRQASATATPTPSRNRRQPPRRPTRPTSRNSSTRPRCCWSRPMGPRTRGEHHGVAEVDVGGRTGRGRVLSPPPGASARRPTASTGTATMSIPRTPATWLRSAFLAPFHLPSEQGQAEVYWWVRVVRKTGEDENGKPVGVDIEPAQREANLDRSNR